jgi:hypothetical protein
MYGMQHQEYDEGGKNNIFQNHKWARPPKSN